MRRLDRPPRQRLERRENAARGPAGNDPAGRNHRRARSQAMSDTKTKLYLGDARLHAEAICRLLEPACQRIEIAGSIRRMAALVGDIEIVCTPKLSDGTES